MPLLYLLLLIIDYQALLRVRRPPSQQNPLARLPANPRKIPLAGGHGCYKNPGTAAITAALTASQQRLPNIAVRFYSPVFLLTTNQLQPHSVQGARGGQALSSELDSQISSCIRFFLLPTAAGRIVALDSSRYVLLRLDPTSVSRRSQNARSICSLDTAAPSRAASERPSPAVRLTLRSPDFGSACRCGSPSSGRYPKQYDTPSRQVE